MDVSPAFSDKRQAALGGVYEFSRHAAANLREKNDSYNEAIGGFLGGATMGLRSGLAFREDGTLGPDTVTVRTIPAVIGFGSALAVIMATFDVTGGSLAGPGQDPNVDVYAQREALRANKRRPIQETIDELGEGRGTGFLWKLVHN